MSADDQSKNIEKLDESNVTAAVLKQMKETTKDERLITVMDSLVRHLHDFARDVDLTPAEWIKGIEYLTKTGQMCSPDRQEFILLSDVLGLSSLVNKMHDRRQAASSPAYHLDSESKNDTAAAAAAGLLEPTQTSLLGPYYRQDSPKLDNGSSLILTGEDVGENATKILLYGTVKNVRGEPISNASIEIWQGDDEGLYDSQKGSMDFRGHLHSSESGLYWCRTVVPPGYMVPLDGPVGTLIIAQGRHGYRPAHIHYLVGAKPSYREVVTAIYLRHDDHIANDTVFGVSEQLAVSVDYNPEDNDVLKEIRAKDKDAASIPTAHIRFDIVLVESAEGDSTGRVGADPKQFLE